MKKVLIFLLLFLTIPAFIYGQTDTVIHKFSDSAKGPVIHLGTFYSKPNQQGLSTVIHYQLHDTITGILYEYYDSVVYGAESHDFREWTSKIEGTYYDYKIRCFRIDKHDFYTGNHFACNYVFVGHSEECLWGEQRMLYKADNYADHCFENCHDEKIDSLNENCISLLTANELDMIYFRFWLQPSEINFSIEGDSLICKNTKDIPNQGVTYNIEGLSDREPWGIEWAWSDNLTQSNVIYEGNKSVSLIPQESGWAWVEATVTSPFYEMPRTIRKSIYIGIPQPIILGESNITGLFPEYYHFVSNGMGVNNSIWSISPESIASFPQNPPPNSNEVYVQGNSEGTATLYLQVTNICGTSTTEKTINVEYVK